MVRNGCPERETQGWPRPCSETPRTENHRACYLGTGEDDGLLEVFQHEGKHRGGKGHGVRAVDDHEALVLCVVSLLGRMSSGQAFGNMATDGHLLTGQEREERPGTLGEGLEWHDFTPPHTHIGPLWKASLDWSPL